MISHSLTLPVRPDKPRQSGLTMMIDNGVGNAHLTDVIESHGHLVDHVKFGWGTALVTAGLEAKMALLREHDIPYFFGGTLFEKHLQQDRFDAFVALCRHARVGVVEVSNGTLPISNDDKCSWIRKLTPEFTVISEVGYKEADHDAEMTPQMWSEFVEQDLASGSHLVITESRESGTSGIASASGSPRDDVLEAVLRVAPAEKLIFEAPTKSLQTHLVRQLGANVNLGNISTHDLVSVETVRLGLRSDTFDAFG